jgi:hypothetical protein
MVTTTIAVHFFYQNKSAGKREALGVFAKLTKAIISFVMSVCPSARTHSAPTERILFKFDILFYFFEKSVDKIQLSLKTS